jgi:hypothetical protein
MKKLLITLIVQDGEHQHKHRILHTTPGNDIHYAAERYAAQFYPEDEPEHLLSWWQFQSGSIAVEVENVRELSDYEYQLLSDLFSNVQKPKPYLRTITGTAIKIKDCKEGDLIALTPTIDIEDNYLNIVVKPSFLAVNKLMNDNYQFNVISLKDGRPRTFHPDQLVYIFKKEDVFK